MKFSRHALLFGLGLACGAAGQAAPSLLNDTGVGFGADAIKGNNTTCSGTEVAQQDCASGRDAALAQNGKLTKVGAGAAGFDFTRICNSGEPAGSGTCPAAPALGPAAGDWACTRDNVSGLVWELKTADAGPRQRDRTYTQFSAAYNPNKTLGSAGDAAGYIAAVNAQRLCGANDWRLPTRLELLNIVHFGAATTQPALDSAFFPNSPSQLNKAVFWAAGTAASGAANAWGVDFSDGSAGDDNRSVYYALRLVRGAIAAVPERQIAADGHEVADANTGLVWRRCAEGMAWNGSTCAGTPSSLTWAEALQCGKAAGGGWRVPNIKELASLVDERRADPAIDMPQFPATPATWFWTATPDAGDPATTWTVHFGTGHSGHHGFRQDRHALRLVRSGP